MEHRKGNSKRDGAGQSRRHPSHGSCASQHAAFALGRVETPAAVGSMPTRVAVLSDIEGNQAFLEAALRELGIVDAHGDWRYGTGHLVILGDSVDRGRAAFAVLWRLRALSAQAQADRGAVHVVLGNHEQYALRGNVSRAHPDHRHALAAMGGAQQAYGPHTVLGDWLRTQPVALKLGRTLFVHGGISPQTLASGLDVEALNAAMRTYWITPQRVPPQTASALLGLSGLTRYRGYLYATAPQVPAASEKNIARTLTRFDVDRVVVGHTLVDRVEARHAGRVWTVDVNAPDAASEVLVFQDGVPRVVPLSASRRLDQEAPPRRRDFDLFSRADWRLLIAMARAFHALSRIPQVT